jgi:hypothetical protein
MEGIEWQAGLAATRGVSLVYNPAMKNARWFTALGSFVLFASALLHGSGYIPLVRRIRAATIPAPLDGILQASWLTFSVQFLALAVIAFLARKMTRGGWIVLLCALFTAIDAVILLYFLGPFVGVYLLTAVTVVFLIGGWLQAKQPA